MDLSWLEALGFMTLGVIGGGTIVYLWRLDKVIEDIRREYHEIQINKERRKLHDSGRTHPRRADAASGPPAKIHKTKMRRRSPRQPGR